MDAVDFPIEFTRIGGDYAGFASEGGWLLQPVYSGGSGMQGRTLVVPGLVEKSTTQFGYENPAMQQQQ